MNQNRAEGRRGSHDAPEWLSRLGVSASRVALGIVFLWFGVAKLFPGASPAEALAGETLRALSCGLVDPWVGVRALGVWESAIGLALLSGVGVRVALVSLFVHMAGTLTPAFLTPDVVFVKAPLVLTMEGQYIVKNVVLVAAALVVAARYGALATADHLHHGPGPLTSHLSTIACPGRGLSLHD